MKPEEVIEIINDLTWNDGGRHFGRIAKARDLAIQALEKQMPKKLTDAVLYPNKEYLAVASCPSCHYHILIYRNEFHCDKCGQAVYLNEVIK